MIVFLCWGLRAGAETPALVNEATLRIPLPGENELHVMAPNWLELRLITTNAASWNFVDSNEDLHLPDASKFSVLVDGKPDAVAEVGFRRRPLYAPLAKRDLRVDNCLYLRLASEIADGQTVEVASPSLWPVTMKFAVVKNPLRFSPAIHVNQTGYMPAMAKKAMVGYYVGSLGEMPVASREFHLVKADDGAVVFSGHLTPRPDNGYTCSPLPYQSVLEADFTSFTNSGQYALAVPGLGVSYPFFIDDGVAAAFARAYALGLYSQRCGGENALPFTRFTHAACHTAPASVPASAEFSNAWHIIASYGGATNNNNPPQSAPRLTNAAAQLYPFIKTGKVDVSGGHHDAGDYSKYTINSANLVHLLVFAADSLPGVGALDNLGLPQSGDGRSDILQEAKWEADFLAKMQDTDGGFYFLVYPLNREYENNVTPDHGDPQIVWPKNTAATAAAVAALAQCSSSPLFRAQFPDAARLYFDKAQRGWKFLTAAIARHGKAGAYQKLLSYGDAFTHDDELAWAACEMFLATGDPQYQQQLFAWFPDPADQATFHWNWWRLYESYGNAIRSYAFAARDGRLKKSQLDATYLGKCEDQIVAAAQDQLTWSRQCAYGSSFPTETKRFLSGGWYFSMDQAFDLAVASALDDYPRMNDPRPDFLEAMLYNMNYEGGCNPVNVSFVEGLGWKRQRDIVNQYAQNDRRILPPSGIPVGNITASFDYLPLYESELGRLSYPSDGAKVGSYPTYDRWADSFNVQTEQTVVNQGKQLAAAAFLMAKTSLAKQPWRAQAAEILAEKTKNKSTSITMTVRVNGFDLSKARVVWEAEGQEPEFGHNFIFSPTNAGPHWIEAEVQMPDGRRAFAATNFSLNLPARF